MFEYEREKSKTKESRKTSLKILKIEIKRSSNNYVILTQMYKIKGYITSTSTFNFILPKVNTDYIRQE